MSRAERGRGRVQPQRPAGGLWKTRPKMAWMGDGRVAVAMERSCQTWYVFGQELPGLVRPDSESEREEVRVTSFLWHLLRDICFTSAPVIN